MACSFLAELLQKGRHVNYEGPSLRSVASTLTARLLNLQFFAYLSHSLPKSQHAHPELLGPPFVKPDWKARFHPQDRKVTDRTGDVFNTSINFGDGKKGEEMCTAMLDLKSGEYVSTYQIQASHKSVTS